MKKLALGIASVAVALSALGGTASANYDDGGTYPPAPVMVWSPTPTIMYGDGLMAKASGLCPGVPAIFAVQDANDWTHRYFSGDVWVNEDGTAWYKFSASELSSFYGQVTVYAKQFGKCTGLATTAVTIKKAAAPAPAPVKPAGNVGAAGDTAPAAAPAAAAAVPAAAAAAVISNPSVAPAVLSSGVSAPAAAAPAAAVPAAAPRGVAGDSLPVTGSDSSQTLQIALVAFAAGLGMLGVSSARRRTAAARNS